MARKPATKMPETAPTAQTELAAPVFHPPIKPVHGSKIDALIEHRKLPATDKPRAKAAQDRYLAWVKEMDDLTLTGDALLEKLVELLNAYKRYIEIDLIYDSPSDHLYRQSGQIKVS